MPKSKPWREIVDRISETSRGQAPVAVLADRTLEQVRERFSRLKVDIAAHGIFATLGQIAVACRAQDDKELRVVPGTGENPTPLADAQAAMAAMNGANLDGREIQVN